MVCLYRNITGENSNYRAKNPTALVAAHIGGCGRECERYYTGADTKLVPRAIGRPQLVRITRWAQD